MICETSHVCLLDVGISLAELSSAIWPDIVAEGKLVQVQASEYQHRVHRTLRQQYPHCSEDVDPPWQPKMSIRFQHVSPQDIVPIYQAHPLWNLVDVSFLIHLT